jgi:fibronectin type 3 domain-containing protein
MNAPDSTNNSYLLEIDGGNCYMIGDVSIPANTWTWVDYQGGNAASKVTVALTAGTHTLKAIGREPSVKIDRIFAVADQNCLPTGFGDNCMVLADTTKPVTTILMPEDLSTVSGAVNVKASATDSSGISKIEFYVQDVLETTDTTAPYEYAWDTQAVADGTYTIIAKAYDAAGNSSFDARSVTVENTVIQPLGAPINISAIAPQSTKVMLQWQPATAAPADIKYRIIRNNVAIATVADTKYTDETVVADTAYSYYVVAVDSENRTSALPASPTLVTTPKLPQKDVEPPTKPGRIRVRPLNNQQINVTWQPSTDTAGIRAYRVYRATENTDPVEVATVTDTSYGDTALESDTDYTYYVEAEDAAGNKVDSSSEIVSASTLEAPAASMRSSAVRGIVKSTTGRPLAGATVTVWVGGKRYQATTNWRGSYSVGYLPAGTYEIKIKAQSYDPETQTIKLNAGKMKWLDVTSRR